MVLRDAAWVGGRVGSVQGAVPARTVGLLQAKLVGSEALKIIIAIAVVAGTEPGCRIQGDQVSNHHNDCAVISIHHQVRKKRI